MRTEPSSTPSLQTDVCGESGLESRSGTMVGSARAASLALGFRTLVGGRGAAFPGRVEPCAGAGTKAGSSAGRCEARAGIAVAVGPERGVPHPRHWWEDSLVAPPTCAFLQRRLSACLHYLVHSFSLFPQNHFKGFGFSLLLLLKRLNMKKD